jgi:hypothetical protein
MVIPQVRVIKLFDICQESFDSFHNETHRLWLQCAQGIQLAKHFKIIIESQRNFLLNLS